MKNKIITVVLSIIIFLIPIIITPSSFDYNLTRYIVLLICGLALLIMFFINIKHVKCDTKDALILIFIILAGYSTIFSVSIKNSIFGSISRYEGLLTLIIYTLIYYSAKYHFKFNKKILNIGMIIYSLILIFAIVQFYMPSNIIKFYPIFGKGAHGTIGNTNFMGSFVSLLLPAFILGYIYTGKLKYYLTSLLAFSVMWMCVARSSWVAFGVYSLIEIIYLILKKDKTFYKRFFILLISFIICFSTITITKKGTSIIIGKVNVVTSEIKKANEDGISKNMGSGRIGIWNMTLKVIKANPIFGCGVDSLFEGLMQDAKREVLEYAGIYKARVDKAHNEYLQIAATMGIPSLVIYLLFVISILSEKIKNILKNKKSILFVLIILSYLVQAFFNISVIAVAPIFWFVLGLSQNKELELE